MFALTSLHGLNNISGQYLHHPSKVSSQPKAVIEGLHESYWLDQIGLPFSFQPYYAVKVSSSNFDCVYPTSLLTGIATLLAAKPAN